MLNGVHPVNIVIVITRYDILACRNETERDETRLDECLLSCELLDD